MISFVCYLWGGHRDFRPEYVNALAAAIRHHYSLPHRFICIVDGSYEGFSPQVEVLQLPAAGRALGHLPNPQGDKFPSSYRRLWTLSREAAGLLGEWVMLLDIDCMVVASLAPLMQMSADFVGWRVRPPPGCPPRFGGGTWLHKTGTRSWVYEDFLNNPGKAISIAQAAGYRGSDQAWISFCLANREAHWPEPSGIYCAQDFRKAYVQAQRMRRSQYGRPRPGVIARQAPPLEVPRDAIILHMNGVEKPWTARDEIVRTHWRPFFEGERRANAQRRSLAVE